MLAKKVRSILMLGLIIGLVLAVIPLMAAANSRDFNSPDVLAKVDPDLLAEIQAEGTADFFIWMAEQADVSGADQLPTKLEKGQYVFDTLRQTAELTQRDLRADLDAQGVQYRPFYVANTIHVISGDQTLLLDIASRSDVAHILPNRQFQLQEPFDQQPGPASTAAVEPNLSFIGAADVWAMGYTGQGIVLAGADTGMQWDHPALINHYRGWDGANADHNYNWWDATGTYPMVPTDGHGHGTHVSGTMVGDDGGSNQIGVAPGAQVIHCKNMSDGGSGNDATFMECFEWVLAPWDLNEENPMPSLAPDAMNNSWGYWGGGAPQFIVVIHNLQAAGILVEVSVGNEGSACGTLRSPGDYGFVLTTGSVSHASGALPGTISGFSSRGPSSLYPDAYMPTIMAPGEAIRSSLPGNTYASWNGTSMAGPHTTGLVGLMWSANPLLVGQVQETIQIIKETAVPLTGQSGSNCGGDYVTGPNHDWGVGTINALAAVEQALLSDSAAYLDGYVTDDSESTPIAGAVVTANRQDGGMWQRITDATGYYTFTVPAGTFDVTAEHLAYTAQTVTGLTLITDTVTSQNFSLTLRGLLWGYVTDYDNETPLAGVTVTADDGTSTQTDTAGYYELYLDAGNYDVTAEFQNYAPDSANVNIVSDQETRQDFALMADVSFVPNPLHVTVPWQGTHTETATLTNRRPAAYNFQFVELPGSFTPIGGSTGMAMRMAMGMGMSMAAEWQLAPSIPAQLSTGVAPAGYSPPATAETGDALATWQPLADAPFSSMDNVYIGYEGKGYQIGGYDTNGQVGIYDVETNTWTTGANAPSPSIQYPASGCFGYNADGDPVGILFNDTTSGITTLHRYNIATDSWDTPPVPTGFPTNGLWWPDIASLAYYTGENVCYISGGATSPGGGNTSTLYAYYPDTNTVENLGNFSYHSGGFAFHASWYVPWIGSQGGICVAGGANAANDVSANTQCYDIGAEVFNAPNADLGAMPAAVWSMANGIRYENGDWQLWIANGSDAGLNLWPNSAYYSQLDGQWQVGPPPPRSVYRVGGANIHADDGYSFYVVGGSSAGFTPTDGHERNFSAEFPPVDGDVPWFGQTPVAGTVPANGSLSATMLFTATYAAGVNQPGDYHAELRVMGEPWVRVPVVMSVLPPDTMGQLVGTVLDSCTSQPLEVEITIMGGDPIANTTSDPDSGFYSAWLYPGTYNLTFSAAGYRDYTDTVTIVAEGAVDLDVHMRPDRPCISAVPDEIEVVLLQGTEIYMHRTGLDLTNNGGQALDFEFWRLADTTSGGMGSISSLTGSFVEFDSAVGGDTDYIPGAIQTFCFMAESHSPDWEYALSVWQKFPETWTVNDVYLEGTPACTDGGSFGAFSWSFLTAPYEVRIDHARFHDSSGDTCMAHYCFDVTTAPVGDPATVSWYWNGDSWGSAPHNPCSDDGYTPAGQAACDEAINPVASVPIGSEVAWFWSDPVADTLPPSASFNVDIMFTTLDDNDDPLPLGEYTATLLIIHNDPTQATIEIPVRMTVVDTLYLWLPAIFAP